MQKSSISDTQSAKRKTLEVVFIFLLFFIVGGDPTPAINEAQYLSKAKHFWNPDWCPDDHFLSSSDAHYVFYWTLGLLAKFTSLEATAWIGRCIGWLFLAIAWQRLSYRFCTKFGSAILSAAVWFTLTYRVHMAGEWVIGGIEAKVIAYGFVLLGLTALADRHWKRVWPYFGIAASFHVLVGGWSVVAAMIAWGLTKKEQRTSLFEMAPFVILGGLLSLPGLLPVLLLSRGIPEEVVAEGARIYVFERLQHHLVFSSFARDFVTRFFVMSVLWAIGWMVLRFGQSQAAIGRFVVGSLVIAVCGIAVDYGIQEEAKAASLLRFYWFRLSDVAVPLGVALLLVDSLQHGFRLRGRVRNKAFETSEAFPVVIVSVVTILCLCSFGEIGLNPDHRWIPGADRQGPIRLIYRYRRWNEACRWIRENINDPRPILAPNSHATFKWNTGRSEVVNWKDVPQDAQGICEWFERLTDIRSFFKTANMTPTNQKKAQLEALAKKYGFRYFLVQRRYRSLRKLPFPRVYENYSYTIYDLGD